jgi:hypothetical protein
MGTTMKNRILIAIALFFCAFIHVSLAGSVSIDENLIVLVADPHIFPGTIKRANDFEAETLTTFKKMVHNVTAMNPRPTAILFLGDLVEQPTVEAYQLLKSQLAPFNEAKIPYHFLLGNHDQAKAFYQVFPEWREKTKATGTLAYRISLPAMDFLTLETTDVSNHGGYFGHITPEAHDWLQKEMRRTPGKPIFIAGHHDVDFAKFYPDLAQEPNFQGWLNGHWHRYEQKTSPEGVRIFWLPSLAFADGQTNPITGYVLLKAKATGYDMTLIRNAETITVPRVPIAKK